MKAPDERPTIGERYGLATEATSLVVDSRVRGPADLLISAGWLGNNLGALLLRLMSEYDAVRGEHLQALQHWRKARQAMQLAPEDLELAEDGPRAAATAQALILIRLKTLGDAKAALSRFALLQATRQRFMRNDQEVGVLTGLVLDAFLDPTCHHCTGLGFTGGYGGPTTPCRPCHQTGKRRNSVGKDDLSRQFAGFLLAQMDRLVATAAGRISKRLHDQPPQEQTDDH